MEYDIALSPTYQVPILYVNIYDQEQTTDTAAPVSDLDTLYRVLIPRRLHSQLREMGVMGAVSSTVSSTPYSVDIFPPLDPFFFFCFFKLLFC